MVKEQIAIVTGSLGIFIVLPVLLKISIMKVNQQNFIHRKEKGK
jgi:hypothetical protein